MLDSLLKDNFVLISLLDNLKFMLNILLYFQIKSHLLCKYYSKYVFVEWNHKAFVFIKYHV